MSDSLEDRALRKALTGSEKRRKDKKKKPKGFKTKKRFQPRKTNRA